MNNSAASIDRVKQSVREMFQFIWFLRGRIPLLRCPVPCRLPGGGRFLAFADFMGFTVFWYNLTYLLSQKPLAAEAQFSFRFLDSVCGRAMVLDVGANQGVYAIPLARHLRSNGTVVAFEPAPHEREKLMRNVSLNHLVNVTVEGLALGRAECLSEFHSRLDHQGSYSSLRPQASDVIARESLIHVQVSTVDRYVESKGLGKVDLIKIDAEGGELDILKGSETTIEQARPLILCEMADIRTEPWGYRALEIYQYLSARRYSWYSITRQGLLRPSAAKPRYDLEENLIAVPAEKVERLRALMQSCGE